MLGNNINGHFIIQSTRDDDIGIPDGGIDKIIKRWLDKPFVLLERKGKKECCLRRKGRREGKKKGLGVSYLKDAFHVPVTLADISLHYIKGTDDGRGTSMSVRHAGDNLLSWILRQVSLHRRARRRSESVSTKI